MTNQLTETDSGWAWISDKQSSSIWRQARY